MPPVRIQLAVQGGGAKLVTLLAAMHGVQDAITEKAAKVSISRLAGTSAGAIAASLLAARIDLEEVRLDLIKHRAELLRLGHVPALPIALVRAKLGREITPLTPLHAILRRFLTHPDRRSEPLRFEHLNPSPGRAVLKRGNRPLIPLLVTATDLRARRGVTRGLKSDDQEEVARAVADSMALPFLFKPYARTALDLLFVDGGLVENFPVETLRTTEGSRDPVLGITFSEGPTGAPTSVRGYAGALLFTAMDAAVRRARQELGEEQLLTLESPYGLLEFASALEHGLGDPWNKARERAYQFLVGYASRERREIQVIEEASEPVMARMGQLYQAHHAGGRRHYIEARLTAVVRALTVSPDDGTAEPDEMRYRLVFQPADQPLTCSRVVMISEDGRFVPGTLRQEVHNARREPMAIIDLFAKAPGSNNRWLLMFHDPALKPDDPAGPFTLAYSQRAQGGMAGLATVGSDYLMVTPEKAAGPINRILLIALIPREHGGFSIRSSPKTTSTVRGRPLDALELVDLREPWWPENHYPVGWIGEGVAPGVSFAAEVYDPSRDKR